jgi:hypothetical protein
MTYRQLWTVRVTVHTNQTIGVLAEGREAAAAMKAVLADHPAVTSVECRPADVHESGGACWGAPPRAMRRRRRKRPQTLADEVRAAARELFRAVDKLHYGAGWPFPEFDFQRRAYEAVQRARSALTQEPGMGLDEMLFVLAPVMDEAWPGQSPLTGPAHRAVDRLRRARALRTYAGADASPTEPACRGLDRRTAA